jgi:hypothetical protein
MSPFGGWLSSGPPEAFTISEEAPPRAPPFANAVTRRPSAFMALTRIRFLHRGRFDGATSIEQAHRRCLFMQLKSISLMESVAQSAE